MQDLKSKLGIVAAMSVALHAATVHGSAINLANFDSAMIVINPGTITDGTHTPVLEELLDDGSTWATVAAAQTLGSFAALATGVPQSVGYIGNQGQIRVSVVVTGSPATGGIYGAVAVLGNSRVQPIPS